MNLPEILPAVGQRMGWRREWPAQSKFAIVQSRLVKSRRHGVRRDQNLVAGACGCRAPKHGVCVVCGAERCQSGEHKVRADAAADARGALALRKCADL